MPPSTESVRVVVRCRPFNERERKQGESNIVLIDENNGSVSILNPKKSTNRDDDEPRVFKFDNSFGEDCRQIDVYNITARPIVDAVLEGYNGTIFA